LVLDDGSRFEWEQDEPLAVDDPIHPTGMGYRVMNIRPLAAEESDEFDAIVEVRWVAGPPEFGRP
jgi:hypothetical protein